MNLIGWSLGLAEKQLLRTKRRDSGMDEVVQRGLIQMCLGPGRWGGVVACNMDANRNAGKPLGYVFGLSCMF